MPWESALKAKGAQETRLQDSTLQQNSLSQYSGKRETYQQMASAKQGP